MKQNFIKWPAHPKILTSHTPPLFVTIDQDNMPGTLSPQLGRGNKADYNRVVTTPS